MFTMWEISLWELCVHSHLTVMVWSQCCYDPVLQTRKGNQHFGDLPGESLPVSDGAKILAQCTFRLALTASEMTCVRLQPGPSWRETLVSISLPFSVLSIQTAISRKVCLEIAVALVYEGVFLNLQSCDCCMRSQFFPKSSLSPGLLIRSFIYRGNC